MAIQGMSIHGQARLVWEELAIGDKITSTELMERAKLDKSTIKIVSGFLSHRIPRNEAVIEGKLDGKFCYKKIAVLNDRRKQRQPETPDTRKQTRPYRRQLTDLDVGRSVLVIIDDLKAKLRDEKQTTKDLVEQNRGIKVAYDQAQKRVIELNTELNEKKTRPVNLSDLADASKGSGS